MRRICMRKLSKYEKETIINWNEAENLASIYTFNASLKRRLAEFSRKYPLLCRLERSTPEGSVTYVLDKSRLSIRLVPPYSEERKAAEMCIRDRLCRMPPSGFWSGFPISIGA